MIELVASIFCALWITKYLLEGDSLGIRWLRCIYIISRHATPTVGQGIGDEECESIEEGSNQKAVTDSWVLSLQESWNQAT